jgi:urease accessory protein
MREFTRVIKDHGSEEGIDRVILTFHQREKSRLKVTTESGEEVGLFLPRGTILSGGDILTNDNGDRLEVVSANEKVSTVTADSPHGLLRIAYHLGNRHVPLQVEPEWLRYAQDSVLDEMVTLLGGHVFAEEAPLHPENGAYGGGHSHHSH